MACWRAGRGLRPCVEVCRVIEDVACEADNLRARVAELTALVSSLCDRLYAAHEVLAHLAEKRAERREG